MWPSKIPGFGPIKTLRFHNNKSPQNDHKAQNGPDYEKDSPIFHNDPQMIHNASHFQTQFGKENVKQYPEVEQKIVFTSQLINNKCKH